MKLEFYSTPIGVFIIKDSKLYRLTVQKVFKDSKDQNEWKWEEIELPMGNGNGEPKKDS